MRSLHESEMWHKIKSRLARYEEEPEDNWDAIIRSLPNKPAKSNARSKLLWVLMVLLLGWLVLPSGFTSSPMSDTQPGLTDQSGETALTDQPTEKRLGSDDSLLTTNQRLNGNNKVDHSPTDSMPAFAAEPQVSAGSSQSTARSSGYLTRDGGRPATADAQKDIAAAPVILDSVGLDKQDEDVNASRDWSQKPASASTSSGEAGPKVDSTLVNIVADTIKTNVSSPSGENKSRKKRSFKIYLSLTPKMTYYKIIPNKNDQVELKGLKSPGVFSPDRLGFGVDIGVQKPISKNLEWFGGAAYSVQNQSIGYSYVSNEITAIEPGADGDYTITPAIKSRSVKHSLHNVHLSSGLLYTVKKAALTQQAGLGLQYEYGLNSIRSEDAVQTRNHSFAMVNFMYRFKWNFSEYFDFYIQPQFTHAINSQDNIDQLYSIKPSRAGVGLGVIYHFKKMR